MKKKNSFLRLALVLLVVASVCASLFAGSTTLAMYTAQATGSADAEIAKWSFRVNGAQIATAAVEELTVDLFSNIKCRQVSTTPTQAANATEVHVAATKIAPGTYGTMGAVVLLNDSDVDAKVDVVIAIDSTAVPALAALSSFSLTVPTQAALQALTGTKVIGTPTATVSATGATFSVNLEKNGGTITLPADAFGWEWAFNDGSATPADGPLPVNSNFDTPIGIAATSTAKLVANVSVTATQID